MLANAGRLRVSQYGGPEAHCKGFPIDCFSPLDELVCPFYPFAQVVQREF